MYKFEDYLGQPFHIIRKCEFNVLLFSYINRIKLFKLFVHISK